MHQGCREEGALALPVFIWVIRNSTFFFILIFQVNDRQQTVYIKLTIIN